MRKIIIYICILITSLMFYGCGCGDNTSSSYYFNIVKNTFVCTVGDNFNIFNEEIKTNLSNYEHMHIYSENNKIAKVLDNKTIDILAEGEVTIIVSGNVKGQVISDSFTIVANNSNVVGGGSSPSENAVFSANKILDTTNSNRVVVYKILKDNVEFPDFIIDESSLEIGVTVSKLFDTVEIVFEIGKNYSINILDNSLNIILTLNGE